MKEIKINTDASLNIHKIQTIRKYVTFTVCNEIIILYTYSFLKNYWKKLVLNNCLAFDAKIFLIA